MHLPKEWKLYHTKTTLDEESNGQHNSTELGNTLDFAMDLISKQENALQFLAETLNSEIDNLKRKLKKLEKETLLKGAKVSSRGKR